MRPSIRRVAILLLAIIFGLAVVGLRHWWLIDTCLDAGGRWDAAARQCERVATPEAR